MRMYAHVCDYVCLGTGCRYVRYSRMYVCMYVFLAMTLREGGRRYVYMHTYMHIHTFEAYIQGIHKDRHMLLALYMHTCSHTHIEYSYMLDEDFMFVCVRI